MKTKSVAFRVNKKPVASTTTSVLVPFAALKIGARNAISVVVTLVPVRRVGHPRPPASSSTSRRRAGGP